MRKLISFFPLFLLALTNVSRADVPTRHGMLVFGKEAVYASHLPMFHSPHDYQVLLRLELSPEDKQVFVDNQIKNKNQRIYTFDPEPFSLPVKIKKGETFTLDLYQGHFEKPGRIRILKNIVVKIADVILFEKFDPKAKRPATAEYVVFGTPTEAFLAHRITVKGNHDHVLEAKVLDAGSFLSPQTVKFEGSDETPITEGTQAAKVKATRELYLEIGELE